MKTNLSKEQVLNISKEYKEKYNLSGIIHSDDSRTIQTYKQYDGVTGIAWLVLVSIVPTIFEADNEYTIIISDEKAEVEYIIDANGHYYCPHLKEKRDLTDEEFDAIWDDEDA
ncbi:hypothetical protein ACINLE_22545 [Bacillus sp. z60-18]|uniref:hypothetical protein n=1 Tax=unclassified Bacillus (in: firmicutes) TaxID=185979 RepID=UPI00390C97B6